MQHAVKAKNKESILYGTPLPTLLRFALPIILGNVFQQLYNIVDALVVGRFLGDLPLSGISVSTPVIDIANALIIGGSIGVGVLIGQLCGASDWDRLKRTHATALIGGVAISLVLTYIGIFGSGMVLRIQGTEEAVCIEAEKYLHLIFAGMPFCFLYNYYASLLRAYGNSRTPFWIILISSVLHAGLDVVFVGVFQWGIRGVAISTLFSQIFSAVWCIVYTYRHYPPVALGWRDFRFERELAWVLLSFAWAAALQQAVVCVGRLLVQGMLTASLGTSVMTGYNMSLRVEQFLFCFSQGLSAALAVCVSQNLGYGDKLRMQRFYYVALKAVSVLGVIFGAICFFFATQIIGLFSDNAEMIAAGALYTKTMSCLYMLSFLGEIIQSFFRGLGRLRLTMLASLGQIALRVCLSYFLIPPFGIPGICVSVGIGWFLLVLFEGTYSLRTAKRLIV